VIRSLAFAAVLALASTTPALAADRVVTLTLDGRPVDRAGGSALARGGVVYGDVVDLVRSFDGILTFHGPAVLVTINGVTATFTAGSRTALIGQGAVVMRGATFLRDGDMFVPLDTFITRVANARLRVSHDRTRAEIFVNSNPLS
jgi:hypothetical protein